MPLSEYQEPTATLSLGNTVLTLRPISPEGLGTLMRHYERQILEVLPAYSEMLSSMDPKVVTFGVFGIFTGLADMVAAAICVSAREPDAFEIAKRLPFMESVRAAISIMNLSGLSLPEATLTQISDLIQLGGPDDPSEVN